MKTVMLLVNPWLGSLFYIFTMIIGILVVLNLFIAIILSGLSDMEELDYESTSRKPFMTSVRDFFTGFLFWRRGDKVAPEPEEPEERLVFESAAANDQEAKDEQPDIVGHVTVEEGAKSVRSMTASSRKPLSEVDQEARNSAMMRMQAAIERVAAGLPPLPELEGEPLDPTCWNLLTLYITPFSQGGPSLYSPQKDGYESGCRTSSTTNTLSTSWSSSSWQAASSFAFTT